jgi:hypothetical protein
MDEPTDYYLRPLLLAAADEIGHTRADNCMLCMGSRSSVDLLLQYATQYTHRFKDQRHFAFVWATSLTHDGLNMAGLADRPFHTALKSMLDHGDLSNTVLFFISDHGVRTGDFRLTPQVRILRRFRGDLEFLPSRLFFLYFVFIELSRTEEMFSTFTTKWLSIYRPVYMLS